MSSTLQLPCPSFLRGGFLFLSFSFIIESWISYKRSLQIINVRHRHCVFTIDASLRDFFLQDRSLLNCLFHSVSSVVLRLFSKMNKHKNFTPGFIMVLHTFGRDLKWNPHIHCLISEGGYSDDAFWRNVSHFNYTFLRNAFRSFNRWRTAILSSFGKEPTANFPIN